MASARGAAVEMLEQPLVHQTRRSVAVARGTTEATGSGGSFQTHSVALGKARNRH